MEYTPRQDREIRDALCLQPGVYDFEVAEATEKVSKKGNDMIELKLRVFAPDGSTRFVSETIDFNLYKSLATISSGETVGDF